MPSIQKIKRKKGIAFQVEYWQNGKRRKQYFPAGTDQKIVQAFVSKLTTDKLLHSINNNSAGIEFNTGRSLTLAQLQTRYLQDRRHEIQTKRHELSFSILIRYLGQDMPITRIDHNLINTIKNKLLEEKLARLHEPDFLTTQRARRGVNKELTMFRTIFIWAYRQGLMPRNIFDKVERFKTADPVIYIPTRMEEKAFRKQLHHPQARLSYYIIRYTGMRRSEVCDLLYRHLDMNKQLIYIEKQKNYKADMLPMHPVLARFLKRYLHPGQPNDRIFDYKPDFLSASFRRALNRAGLQHIKNPVHVFRHTFVTNLLKSTGDLALTRDLARHSNFNTTKRYLHLIPEDHREKFTKAKL